MSESRLSTQANARENSIAIFEPSSHSAANANVANALTEALPYAHTVPARSPPGVDASDAKTVSRQSLVTTLGGLVTGHWPRQSASEKAEKMLQLMPATEQTPESLRRIANAVQHDEPGVKNLLNLSRKVGADGAARLKIRSALLAALARGATLGEAKGVKKDLLRYAALEKDIIGRLKRNVNGDFRGDWATTKAKKLIRQMPAAAQTEQGLENIDIAIRTHERQVREVLDFGPNDLDVAAERLRVGAGLLALMAENYTLDDVKTQKSMLLKQGAIEFAHHAVADDGAFLDSAKSGTPVRPLAMDLVEGSGETIMKTALGVGNREDNEENKEDKEARVAWMDTTLGATRSDYLLSHSFATCQPVIVFWKAAEGGQKATLFHFAKDEEINDLQACLQKIDSGMKVDSISWVERVNNRDFVHAKKKELCRRVCSTIAKNYSAPFNVISSQADNLALAVDVKNAKVVTMDQTRVGSIWNQLPTPKRFVDMQADLPV